MKTILANRFVPALKSKFPKNIRVREKLNSFLLLACNQEFMTLQKEEGWLGEGVRVEGKKVKKKQNHTLRKEQFQISTTFSAKVNNKLIQIACMH